MNIFKKPFEILTSLMGCSYSSIKVAAKPKEDGIYSSANQRFKSDAPEDSFNAITNDNIIFFVNENSTPSICISPNAFPLITKERKNDSPFDLRFSLISASVYQENRIVCLPTIDLFSPASFSIKTIKQLLRNVLAWASQKNCTSKRALVFNMPSKFSGSIMISLEGIGYFCEIYNPNFRYDLSEYHLLILTSDFDSYDEKCVNFVESFLDSKCGIVFININQSKRKISFPCNPYLSKFGLAFSTFPTTQQSEQFFIEISYEQAYGCHFLYYIHILQNKLNISENWEDTPQTPELSEEISIEQKNLHIIEDRIDELDTLVSSIRYLLNFIDEIHQDEIKLLMTVCTDYLNRSGACENGQFCPYSSQQIILVLLQEVFTKVSPQFISPLPGLNYFPGEIQDNNFIDSSLVLTIHSQEWVSTGLYLPPGEISKISIESIKILSEISNDSSHDNEEKNYETIFNGIRFQVGCHTQPLLFLPPPWKRWPILSSSYQPNPISTTTELSSPVGGILYIQSMSTNIIEIKLNFKHFLQYPRYVSNELEIWNKTKEIQVPFGEIETKNLIITASSDSIRKLEPEIHEILTVFDKAISVIIQQMNFKMRFPFRIVLDIQLPNSMPTCSYPIVFESSTFLPLFSCCNKPSDKLFAILNLIALVSLREDCFDAEVEMVLAEIATRKALKTVFPDFDDSQISISSNRSLYATLDKIEKDYPNIISKSLAKFQDLNSPIPNFPEDAWLDFVKEMCLNGQTDFVPQLEEARPIPLNVSSSLQRLLSPSEMNLVKSKERLYLSDS